MGCRQGEKERGNWAREGLGWAFSFFSLLIQTKLKLILFEFKFEFEFKTLALKHSENHAPA